MLLLYVDNMLIVGKNIEKISQLKKQLKKSFAIKELGLVSHILGITIYHYREKGKIWLY